MLTPKQVKEIKEHLDKAQNPIFFYDNDPDGLCSFLLLRKYLGRGRGVAIKSFPELNSSYFRKVQEFNSDYIFILDKPIVSQEFWKEVEQINIPVVWIDHHDTSGNLSETPDFIGYYNVFLNKTSTNEPVTALCYQVTKRKEDLWIAVMGCISDRFVPDFYSEFVEKYPDLIVNSSDAFDIFYKSKIGKIAKILGFAIKDSVTNVLRMQKFLLEAKTPYEVFEENNKNYSIHKRFDYVNKKYTNLFEKAKELVDERRVLFFQYGGDLSISSDLSNELSYYYPEKIVVVVYITGVKANISMRGENVKKIISEATKDLENARGGGHDNAVGGQVKIEDLEKFRERVENIVEESA